MRERTTAPPGCFVAGPTVKRGLFGTIPSLTDLEKGEPKMTTDFRSLYASLLGDWMGLSTAEGETDRQRTNRFVK